MCHQAQSELLVLRGLHRQAGHADALFAAPLQQLGRGGPTKLEFRGVLFCLLLHWVKLYC